MDPGLVKGFIGVDVADPGDHGLIEQGDLDGSGGSSQRACDLSCTQGGGFRTQSAEESRFEITLVRREMEASESSGIDEPKTDRSGFLVLEDPGHVSVCRNRTPFLRNLQSSRHPEANHRGGPILESKYQLLSAAIQRFQP